MVEVLTSNGSGSDPTWQAGAIAGEGVSKFVVDSGGTQGYTTIQAAINDAKLVATSTTPQTVWIWPGTYAENALLVDYVNLAAASADSVFVVGNSSYTTSVSGGFCSVSNISFTTPGGGGAAFTIASESPANNCHMFIQNCIFNATTGTGLASTDSQGAVTEIISNCLFNTGSGFKSLDFTNNSVTNFQSCVFQAQDTPSILSATLVIFLGCTGQESFQIINGSFIFMKHCFLQGVSTVSQFQIDSNSNFDIAFCDLDCNATNTYWASGYNPGSGITYGNMSYTAIAPSRGTAIGIDP